MDPTLPSARSADMPIVTMPSDQSRDAPLRMPADEFRRAGHALVDSIAGFLESLAQRPVAPSESPAAVQELIAAGRAFPQEGTEAGALLAHASTLLFDHSLFNGHPRFFGYITASPAPIGMLGDLLAAAVNANVGSWRLAPVATEIEAQTVRWIADLIGFSDPCGGLLVSGGNMANIVGLLAARAAAATWDVRKGGTAGGATSQLRIYASAETHTWIQKAADIAGLGTDSIRWIPTDADLRMNTTALRHAIEHDQRRGELPMIVIGTAGSVSTGAIDPLREIAEICRQEGIWCHVDGAYGALAATIPGVPTDLGSLSLADSVAVDPHKWMYAPLEAGCLIVRDPATLRAAFSYHPPYYHFGQQATNYIDYGPQNSRGFRALKVWLAMQQVGRVGYVRMIGDDIRLSQRMHAAVSAHPDLESVTQSLSISTFRFVPRELQERSAEPGVATYLNTLNEALLERIQQSGELFVSNAVIGGHYVLRACIVNFNTTAVDVDAVSPIVVRLGADIDRTLRPHELR
jgi:aromatic-L-amino-acid decarboxylase